MSLFIIKVSKLAQLKGHPVLKLITYNLCGSVVFFKAAFQFQRKSEDVNYSTLIWSPCTVDKFYVEMMIKF